MVARKLRLPVLALVLFLGLLIGSVLGRALGVVLPEGMWRTFLVEGLGVALGPVTVDLAVFSFTVGFSFDINVTGVIGVLALAQVLRWY